MRVFNNVIRIWNTENRTSMNAHYDELRNSHLFVTLRVITTVWIRSVFYSRRADKSPQFGLFSYQLLQA
jgi:hypothetical protein